MIGSVCLLLFTIPKYYKSPTLVGGAVGIITATIWMAIMVLYAFIEGPVYQGQLYHEDGPDVFFLLVAFFWFIGSLVAAWFGMLVGSVIGVFVGFVESASSNPN